MRSLPGPNDELCSRLSENGDHVAVQISIYACAWLSPEFCTILIYTHIKIHSIHEDLVGFFFSAAQLGTRICIGFTIWTEFKKIRKRLRWSPDVSQTTPTAAVKRAETIIVDDIASKAIGQSNPGLHFFFATISSD